MVPILSKFGYALFCPVTMLYEEKKESWLKNCDLECAKNKQIYRSTDQHTGTSKDLEVTNLQSRKQNE